MKNITKNRYTGKVIFESDSESFKLHIELCLSKKISLRGANMSGANMSGADMSEADMREADMSEADMRGANMSGANMSGADMSGANMRGADMRWANMSGANMRGADMREADMRGANMRWANMSGANMSGADMREADMRGAAVIVYGLAWTVHITNGHVRIGCESHELDDWESFDDEKISGMDEKALEFWSEYKNFIIQRCKQITKVIK